MSRQKKFSITSNRTEMGTKSEHKTWRPFGIYVKSKDSNYEERFSTFNLWLFGYHLTISLGKLIKPFKHYVKTSIEMRNGEYGYWDEDVTKYGFMISDGHWSIFYGRVTHSSDTEKQIGGFLPWTQWKYLGISYYDLEGNLLRWVPQKKYVNWKKMSEAEQIAYRAESTTLDLEQYNFKQNEVPRAHFLLMDMYNKDEVIVSCYLEERQWSFGEKWCSWMGYFRPKKIVRSVDLWFNKEVGSERGSWKGGLRGHSIEPLQDETISEAVQRYCLKSQAEAGARRRSTGLIYLAPCDAPPPEPKHAPAEQDPNIGCADATPLKA